MCDSPEHINSNVIQNYLHTGFACSKLDSERERERQRTTESDRERDRAEWKRFVITVKLFPFEIVEKFLLVCVCGTIEASRFHDVKIVNYWQSFYDGVSLSFLQKRKRERKKNGRTRRALSKSEFAAQFLSYKSQVWLDFPEISFTRARLARELLIQINLFASDHHFCLVGRIEKWTHWIISVWMPT